MSDKMSDEISGPLAGSGAAQLPLSPLALFSTSRIALHILEMPVELLTMIMYYLDLEVLAKLVHVSRKFRDITMPFILQKLASDTGMPPLQWAVTHRKHRLLEVLLRLPAYSINESDEIYSTPLECAVASKDPDMVSHIIKLGADVNL